MVYPFFFACLLGILLGKSFLYKKKGARNHS